MATDDQKAVYLERATEARGRATCASNLMIMDEYLDIAAAWRALAAEADQLAARRRALEAPVSILTKPILPRGTRLWGQFGPTPFVMRNQDQAIVVPPAQTEAAFRSSPKSLPKRKQG